MNFWPPHIEVVLYVALALFVFYFPPTVVRNLGSDVQKWQAFLNSLSTRGGAVLILLFLVMLDIAVTLCVVWKGWDSSMMVGAMVAGLGAFTGALLLALKGSSDPTPPPIVSQQTTTTSTASIPPEPTPAVSKVS